MKYTGWCDIDCNAHGYHLGKRARVRLSRQLAADGVGPDLVRGEEEWR